jgi:hypothetical protein
VNTHPIAIAAALAGHRSEIMTRIPLQSSMFAAALALACVAARADIVTDWNEQAVAVLQAEKLLAPATTSARSFAIMHTAMFDAVNAVDKRFAPYVAAALDGHGASPPAAAHAAARRVLDEMFPKQRATVDAAYETAIAKLPDDAARAAGIALGERAADAMLEQRKSDGFTSASEYRPFTTPGVYVPTALPTVTNVARIKPFALQGVSQFRPGPPPALTDAIFARDYNETREWGGSKSAKRTPWQTETAQFWVQVGSYAWNEAARGLAVAKPLPLAESARLFAQLNLALFDGYMAVFDAKYAYNFWRPVTAIRNGDHTGNEATARDAGWTPLIDTPMHPEYPCAHCCVDGSAGEVLKSVFGSGAIPEFTLTYAAMPGVKRSYTSIQQLEDEVAMARIWGGVHYRNSNEVGHALGSKVGDYIVHNTLQPQH